MKQIHTFQILLYPLPKLLFTPKFSANLISKPLQIFIKKVRSMTSAKNKLNWHVPEFFVPINFRSKAQRLPPNFQFCFWRLSVLVVALFWSHQAFYSCRCAFGRDGENWQSFEPIGLGPSRVSRGASSFHWSFGWVGFEQRVVGIVVIGWGRL